MGLLLLILTLQIKNIYRKNQSLNQLKTMVSNIFWACLRTHTTRI